MSTSIFVEESEEKLEIGSGIIVTSDGLILANAEIVGEKGSNCYVTLKNGNKYVGNVVWVDSDIDVAIIKIAAENLITMQMGDSDEAYLGEDIYLISNPTGYGINQSLQTGIISEINKTFKMQTGTGLEYTYIEDIMKLNFEISYNQSGSPILNKNGELVGIVSYKINSVIPINRIKNIISQLENNGEFKEAYLGVNGFDYDAIKFLNVSDNLDYGIYIDQVEDDSPLKEKVSSGDILLKIDDIELSKMQDLTEYLYTKNPGDTVKLIVLRKNEQLELEIELLEK